MYFKKKMFSAIVRKQLVWLALIIIYIFLLGIRDQGGIESRVADRGGGLTARREKRRIKGIIKGTIQRTFWYTRNKVSEGT
jgi:hypothetical protein